MLHVQRGRREAWIGGVERRVWGVCYKGRVFRGDHLTKHHALRIPLGENYGAAAGATFLESSQLAPESLLALEAKARQLEA